MSVVWHKGPGPRLRQNHLLRLHGVTMGGSRYLRMLLPCPRYLTWCLARCTKHHTKRHAAWKGAPLVESTWAIRGAPVQAACRSPPGLSTCCNTTTITTPYNARAISRVSMGEIGGSGWVWKALCAVCARWLRHDRYSAPVAVVLSQPCVL